METENGKKNKEKPRILIVDDISINVGMLRQIVEGEGYEALCALSVQEALDIMDKTLPHLILSDMTMPTVGGLEFCEMLKSNPRTRNIPFVFITVANTREEKRAAFTAGAVDFIAKPFEPVEVIMRVNNHLEAYRIRQELEDYNRMMHKMMTEQKRMIGIERENVLIALTKILKKRSFDKGEHMERVGYNCRLLAQSLQIVPQYESKITDDLIETIETAAMLHDIGTLVMPDEVLSKQNDSEEDWKEIVKQHTEEGSRILEEICGEDNAGRFLDMAIKIAKYHHARWDGTGYPEGISGSDIPLAARIIAVANDFDNLLFKRQYSLEKSKQIINDRSGTVYDPRIVEVFNKVTKQMKTI